VSSFKLAGSDLVKQASESFITGLLLLLLLLGLGCGGSCVRVGDAVLQLLYLGPAVLGLNSNGQDLLVAVDDGVDDGRQGGEVGSQRDGRDGGDGAGESLEQLGLLNVQDAGGERVAIVIHLANAHTVGEGRDVEHVEEGGLGGSDFGAGLDELQVGRDFNGTTSNLGGDTESLEERGLSGLHSGVTSGDVDVRGGDGTGTSGRSDLVGKNLLTDILQVGVGEDEANIALDVGKEALVLGVVADEALDGTTNLHERISCLAMC
jgi:hypothetical protein